MKQFIRLDYDGNFRGVEHISSFCGDEGHFEKGISCYEISKETIFDSIEELYHYWTDIAMEYDFSNYQITIFEGVRVLREDGQKEYGSDYEDIAECTSDLIIKLNGDMFNEIQDLFNMNQNYKDGFTDEEDDPWIDDETLKNKINEMFTKYVK